MRKLTIKKDVGVHSINHEGCEVTFRGRNRFAVIEDARDYEYYSCTSHSTLELAVKKAKRIKNPMDIITISIVDVDGRFYNTQRNA